MVPLQTAPSQTIWLNLEYEIQQNQGRNSLLASFPSIILNPAVGIATESQRAQSKWKRGSFSDALSLPQVTIFQDL